MNKGIVIGYTFIRAREWKFQKRLKQCHNCQKLGHYKEKCNQEIKTCLRCSGSHDNHFSTCNNQVKCENCDGPHPSCSKSCPSIQENFKQVDEEKEKENKNQARYINTFKKT